MYTEKDLAVNQKIVLTNIRAVCLKNALFNYNVVEFILQI